MKWLEKLSAMYGPVGNPFLRLSPADRRKYFIRGTVIIVVLIILNELRMRL